MLLLDSRDSLLVVIDVQGKLFQQIPNADTIKAATLRLMRLADLFEVPVVLTEQYPRGLGPTDPDIRDGFDALEVETRYLDKTRFSCCGVAPFDSALDELRPPTRYGPRQVVLAGIESHVCVMQTALDLTEQGDEVFVCAEAVGSRSETFRAHALDRMAHAGVTIINHESVAFEWARDKAHPKFKQMSAMLREMLVD